MKKFLYFLLILLLAIKNIRSKEDVLSEKVEQLKEWSLKKPVIHLNNERFKQFIKTPPRNYSMIVMLTALSPQRQCGICQQASDEYHVLAQSYRYSKSFTNRLFFGMVDFDDGAEVFQYLKLNSAPVFIRFPPNMKPKKSDYMDINRVGYSAEHLAKWVHECTDIRIEIYRPPNYSGYFMIILFVITIGGIIYIKRNSLQFVFNHVVWGIFVIGVVCYFISGQTWNLINGPPFVSNRKNGMEIFSDDSNMQYIAETYIVFLLYFGVSAGMIILNEVAKSRSPNRKIKSVIAVIGLLIVIILFSYLLSIFRWKYHGYPYSFLIK